MIYKKHINFNKNILIFVVSFLLIYLSNLIENYHRKLKIGIICLEHSNNIGNNLLKLAIYNKISELGYNPIMIGTKAKNNNISFIQNAAKIRIIQTNFSEIKENDYDILIVNSDQTWRKWDRHFYDIAFLRFSEKWDKYRFIYGASLGYDSWKFSKEDENIAKHLLKNFKSLSFREMHTVEFVKEHLGYKSTFVLDPTLLINKDFYLDLIKDYKSDIKINDYIFVYRIINSTRINNFLEKVKETLNINLYVVNMNEQDQIYKFLYGIHQSRGVITDSFHASIFSIIFNKPFIAFVNQIGDDGRFKTIKDIFKLENRIYNINETAKISLLKTPLNINKKLLNSLKRKSLNYLKNNLKSYINVLSFII